MRFLKDERGAVLVYVTLIMGALLGLTGIALDSGRLFTLRQEMQNAADAAALAGAWQLDGTVQGSGRADQAARGAAAIAPNGQKFGATPGTVAIASTAFFSAAPLSDDAPMVAVPPPYDYIQVTTNGVVQNTLLMRAFGGAPTVTLAASAVARKGLAKCSVTPLAICNPNETPGNPGAPFNPALYYGKQLLSKAQGGSGQWAPGNWGLLDTTNGQQGTNALAQMIGGVQGLPSCISATGVDPKPGSVTAVRNAFNVRFDMYDAPLFNNQKNNPNYPPARNVVKGIKPTNASCNNYTATARVTTMPRDTNIPTTISATSRFGNGQWNCASYWTTNHPGGPSAPAGCGAAASTTLTRYEVYYYEATTGGLIPNTSTLSPQGDNGNPQCYQNTIPPTPSQLTQRQFDRRVLTVAVIDCIANNVQGNQSGSVPVKTYLSTFMTESVAQPPDADLYLEIVGSSNAGGAGPVPVTLNDWVELVR